MINFYVWKKVALRKKSVFRDWQPSIFKLQVSWAPRVEQQPHIPAVYQQKGQWGSSDPAPGRGCHSTTEETQEFVSTLCINMSLCFVFGLLESLPSASSRRRWFWTAPTPKAPPRTLCWPNPAWCEGRGPPPRRSWGMRKENKLNKIGWGSWMNILSVSDQMSKSLWGRTFRSVICHVVSWQILWYTVPAQLAHRQQREEYFYF